MNVNSLSSKFEQLKILIQGKVDTLIITETKLDDSSRLDQFVINGYSKPYRLDRTQKGGGIIIHILQNTYLVRTYNSLICQKI